MKPCFKLWLETFEVADLDTHLATFFSFRERYTEIVFCENFHILMML
jgi:hypothetical protein